MEFYIYGAGYLGRKAYEEYRSLRMEDDKCLGFVDAYKKGKFCGEKIFSIDEISFDSTVVISIINPFVSCDIYMLLRSKGIRKIYWYKEYLYLYNRTGSFWKSCIDCSNWGENVLPHGEIHVIDKCNLNCHGCMHFCPLYYGEKDQPTLESCTSTLKMIKEKVTSIAHFSILGGEPFLTPNLKDYIQMVRKLFPETEITLTTNGLLIPDAADELMACIKTNKIVVGISVYKPTSKIGDRICKKLDEWGIAYNYQPVGDFRLGLSTMRKGKFLADYCISDGCSHLRNGTIARCPMLMYVSKINDVFGTSFPTEGILDIGKELSGEELLKKLKKRVPLCDYCIDYAQEWDICNMHKLKLSDFVLEEE